eukprot:GHVS01072824.1.p1 GENE.GHVS01072824.1~~GHVS01072824.1.p1  ORF type:complete len:839 (-),score=138.58 GHVS01072824.1:86-2602(-)
MATNKKEELNTASALKRVTSEVYAVDKSGSVYKGFQIWSDLAPAVKETPDIMFAKCLVMPGSTKEKLQCKQVEPADTTETVFDVPSKNAWNLNSNIDPLSYGDIGMLPHTNIPCVLDFLMQRFKNDMIYTTADPLVVAINPFRDLGNTTNEVIAQYRDAVDVTKLPPHIFYTSRRAFDDMHAVTKSQTIIVSGESGAGKTEATKQMMRFFASTKSGNLDTRIQTAVMAANPVLEAFGNAKTVRNNNSSRFGRFMQLQVGREGGIEFGSVIAFLLEKSRILTQEASERSYHIFYQFMKGADEAMKKKLGVLSVNDYNCINPACTEVEGINDVEEFEEVQQSFKSMKMSESQIASIWSIVSGVLLLGNVKHGSKEMSGVPDAAVIEGEALVVLDRACALLFLDKDKVLHELTVKTTYAGGQKIEGCWKKDESAMLTQSLAKAMYEKLFMWIIKFLNSNIEPTGGFKYFMGMLDIFGFEVFKNNSLEQLFINVTNEMLQKNFTDIVFERESQLYKDEGVSAAELQFTSNKAVIDALTDRKQSLMSTLEDQCLAPGGTDEKFVSGLLTTLKGNAKIRCAKVGANINFVVTHTIGDIQYNAENFLYKNKDILRADLMEVVQASPNEVVVQLFEGIVMEKGKLAKGQLIGSQFMLQLNSLMTLINSTEPHFVRCVKPNDTKKPLDWTASKTLIQLHALSILEALQLRQLGFSYRRPFSEFLFQFRFVDVGLTGNPNVDGREATRKLLGQAKIDKADYAFGHTMIFMKQQAAKDMTKKQRECLAAWEPLVEVLEAMYLKKRYRKELAKRLPAAVRIQAHLRRQLVSRNIAPAAAMAVAGGEGGWW